MRILSSGDFHFNCGYDQDVSDSVDQIRDYVAKNRVDLIALTGDIYERASEPGSRNIAAEKIQELALLAPVLITRGNHDAPGDLKILERIRANYPVRVYEIPEIHIREESGIMVHALPWLTKARWLKNHPYATKEESDRTVSQMLLQYLTNEVALNPGYKHILVGHLTVAGARAQNHQQLGADGVTLGLYDLQEAGFYASLLGHIHLKQELSGPLHIYNGSICALDYGETPDKYFSVLDTDKDEIEWIPLATVPREDVTATWTSTGIEMDGGERLRGARVRVSLRVEGGDNVDAAREQIEREMKLACVLEHKINIQILNPAQLRAAEIAMATSLKDKLEQYWKATYSPDEAKQSDILAKLSELEEELCSQSN